MEQFVLFATPTFEGRPCLQFTLSFSGTVRLLDQKGIKWDAAMLAGDPYLPKVRNRLVAKFLSEYPQATDLFFLDDDLSWPPDAVLSLLQREEDIVFGCYPHKKDALSFPVELEMDEGKLIEKAGLYQSHLAPTGFMRIKRRVLEQMAQMVGRYMEKHPDGSQHMQWNIFEARFVDLGIEGLRRRPELIDGLSEDDLRAFLKRAIGVTPPPGINQWWGEDFWFVERWREMGGTVWVDPEISFEHRGSKAWRATFGDSVRATLRNMAEKDQANVHS